jgi:hypothetical protein
MGQIMIQKSRRKKLSQRNHPRTPDCSRHQRLGVPPGPVDHPGVLAHEGGSHLPEHITHQGGLEESPNTFTL